MGNVFALQQSLASAAVTWGGWEMLHCESVGVLVWDAAFVMLCERLKNYCFIITFVLEIAPYPPITVIPILCKYCDI